MTGRSDPIQLQMRPALRLDNDQFYYFCQTNDHLRLERTADHDLIILPHRSAIHSLGIVRLIRYLDEWAAANETGRAFSSAGYYLPNGSMRSPDLSWVSNERLKDVSDADWNKFPPLCLDFVLELRSPIDRLPNLQAKMQEYIANGAHLGWLLDPVKKRVHIYRPKMGPKILDNPDEVSGDPVLPNFKLPIPKIWAAMQRIV